jgi:hypothetical protein
MQKALSTAALASVLVTSGAAYAEPAPEPCDSKPWVLLVIPETLGAPQLRTDVLRQLRAGLSARGIGACTEQDRTSSAAIARVELAAPDARVVAIDVRAEDALTAKRISRQIDLSGLPRDAWALTLALTIDELLRASWAELALDDAPPPRRPVPVEIRQTVRDSLRKTAPPPAEPSASVGSALVGEAYTGGQLQVGVDARAGIWLLPTLTLQVLVGLRRGFTVSAEHGDVSSSAVVAGLGIGLTPVDPHAELGVDVLGRIEASRFEFQANAAPGATGTSESAVGVVAKAGAAGWLSVSGQLRISVELLAGTPLVAVSATEDGHDVTGASGVALSGALGLAGVF